MFLLDTSVLIRLRQPSILPRIEELDGAGLAELIAGSEVIGSIDPVSAPATEEILSSLRR